MASLIIILILIIRYAQMLLIRKILRWIIVNELIPFGHSGILVISSNAPAFVRTSIGTVIITFQGIGPMLIWRAIRTFTHSLLDVMLLPKSQNIIVRLVVLLLLLSGFQYIVIVKALRA